MIFRAPKPKIWKQGGKWMLKYYFRPRSFWVFGADAEERARIAAMCVLDIEFRSFPEAVNSLKFSYQCNQVAR